MKNILFGMISIVVAVFFLFLAGEAAIRLWHFYKNNFTGQMNPWVIALDDRQGWLPVPDYHFAGKLLDSAGHSYPVAITTNNEGYRLYGDAVTAKPERVLFLGDSFTHAMQVSNDKTYYALLETQLGIDAFAFGVDGYGTLQEYLLLDRIYDDVAPDMVVLQLCPNDFINNHFDLELQSAYNNNRLRRPYLIGDGIEYRTPADFPRLREFASRYSRFLYYIFTKVDRLKPVPEMPAERLIEQQGLDYALFQESVAITDKLLGKIRARVPAEIPIYTFATHHQFPYLSVFRALSEKNGMHFIEGTSQAVAALDLTGQNTRAADGAHWNNAGHYAVAEVLSQYFQGEG